MSFTFDLSPSFRHLLLSVAAVVATGCGGDDPAPAETDSGTLDTGVADGSSDSPTEAGADVADATPDTPTSDPKPVVLALSAAGHDRLFGLAWDATGDAVYGTGAISDAAGADADTAFFVVKMKADGSVDKSFGVDGIARKNVIAKKGGEVARGIVVQSSGKIVVAGTVEHAGATDDRDRDLALVRFTTDGKVDTTFGTEGVVVLDLSPGELAGTTYLADGQWGLSVFPGDQLLVTGSLKATGRTDTDFALVKLSADGARDKTFGTDGLFTLDIDNTSASPRTATILTDGSAVLSGYYRDKDSIVRPVLAKVKPDGTADKTFGKDGVFNDVILPSATEAYGAALQGTSFVTVGYGRATATESLDWLSLRVTAGGALDKTFGKDGVARLDLAGQNDNGRALVVLPDQRILLVGGGRPTATNSDAMVALLSKDGLPDTTFGTNGVRTYDLGGVNDFFWAVAVSPKKDRIALGGVRGVDATTTEDDESAILMLPLPK
ncbi:MAG: hypothetical protein IPJ34_36595 [Myxococcales bacterium]|nr:hypothetical protein [Myxococcales bacterium]